MKKTCFKCGARKDIGDFYRHPQMADGHLNKCKTCTKTDTVRNRNNKIDYYREYDRKRGNRQPVGYLRKYRAENPERYAAHVILNNRIRNGSIKKKPCKICGSAKCVHGHHEDYSKPLEVTWLCPACHRKLHVKQPTKGAQHGDKATPKST